MINCCCCCSVSSELFIIGYVDFIVEVFGDIYLTHFSHFSGLPCLPDQNREIKSNYAFTVGFKYNVYSDYSYSFNSTRPLNPVSQLFPYPSSIDSCINSYIEYLIDLHYK